MSDPQHLVFDTALVRRRRARLAESNFLLDVVAAELADRLSAIKRTFATAISHNAQGGTLARHLAPIEGIGWTAVADSAPPLFAPPSGPALAFDEEVQPFGPETLDLYVSALTLSHANDLPGTLIQVRRALRPDGLFLAAMLGGDSLHELRHAMLTAEADLTGGASPRVAPFADIRDLGGLLQRAGFALPVVDADRLTVRYDTALDLMRELKSIGLTSALAGRGRRPVTRGLLMRAAETYQASFAHADGRVPATFEIVYLTGWAPDESQQKPLKPGSARTRLADALGTQEHKL